MIDALPRLSWSAVTLLLLAAQLAFGLTIIAILPPFEGFDEDRHFSRLQTQTLAPTDSVVRSWKEDPRSIGTRMTRDVFDYYKKGPMPYYWIYGQKTYNHSTEKYISYSDFFKNPPTIEGYLRAYRQASLPSEYSPASETNVQYQHPGLYYGIVGQALKFLSGQVSFVTAVLTLRILSFLLAFAGFCIGLYATRAYLGKTGVQEADKITALGALYPFLMPQYSWEFARMGNDSMCLFLFGITWACLLWHMRAPRSEAWLGLGFCLGLGWLTKALMLPISAGIMLFLAVYHLRIVRYQPGRNRDWWQPPLKALGILLAVGAPLYLINYVGSGDFGAMNFQRAVNAQDAWPLLVQHFSVAKFVEKIWVMLHTFVWVFGSWSLLAINIPIYKALVAFTAVIFALYVLALRCRRDPLFHLPFYIIVPVVVGLFANIFVAFILQNNDGTPGYYLHILAPCFALIYGLSLKWSLERKWLATVMACLCLPIILLNFINILSYMTAFAGCAVPVLGNRIFLLSVPDVVGCLGQFSLLIESLSVLAWPHFALVSLAVAFILLEIAAILAVKIVRDERHLARLKTH
ncbi:MAG: hypothetical protein SFW62_09180 [Alphaproteobacteria bacterium]|nr:hypothetical protein [Alphaproteobacteria bacterium]